MVNDAVVSVLSPAVKVAVAVNTLSVLTRSMLRPFPEKSAIPATADMDFVPERVPEPVVNDMVIVFARQVTIVHYNSVSTASSNNGNIF